MNETIFETTSGCRVFSTFESMGLAPALLKGVYAYGFEVPSAVQQRAVVPILKGSDVIVQSQSGTGKTCVFSLGALALVTPKVCQPQVLILSPTRELAEQSQKVCLALGHFMSIQVHCCIGGKKLDEDVKSLKSGMHIVSGTPGRVLQLIRGQHLQITKIKLLILDEIDEIMNQGLKEPVEAIHRYLSIAVQAVCVSATMPAGCEDFIDKFTKDPIRILVKKENITLAGIKQFFVFVDHEKWKFGTLLDLYSTLSVTYSVVFCNSKDKVTWLTKKLLGQGFPVVMMHGDMTQKDRETAMENFRAGKSRLLVATDLWGRGLDVSQVAMVVNFDLPTRKELYIHRVGRSGRFGRKGVAINFVRSEDVKLLKTIEDHYGTQIDEMPNKIEEFL